MPVFTIHHITRYEYDRPVKESVNEIRIFPYTGRDQEVLHHQLNITQSPQVFQLKDYWGNITGMFNLMPPHKELVIESKLIVRTLGKLPATPAHATLEDLRADMRNKLNLLELAQLTEPDLREKIGRQVQLFYAANQPVDAIVAACAQFIYQNFKYLKGITSVETTVEEILGLRSGVCQDFAHLMLEMLRYLGIPCRYVSGYICPNKNGMRGEGATHAWVEAWIPPLGWAGIDPTNNIWVNDTHVKLAAGRNFNDCSPVKGTFKGPARQSLSVFVSVSYEDGQTSEEVNNVRLNPLLTAGDLPEFGDADSAQQQQ